MTLGAAIGVLAFVVDACGSDEATNGVATSDGGADGTTSLDAALSDATVQPDVTISTRDAGLDVEATIPDVQSGIDAAFEADVGDSAADAGDAAEIDAADASLIDAGTDAASDAGVVLPPCAITAYPLPDGGSIAQWIAPSPDGELWFSSSSTVGRVAPLGPDGGQGAVSIIRQGGNIDDWQQLAAGPDGQMWIFDVQQLHQFLTATGTETSRIIQSVTSAPVRGPGSTLWFAVNGVVTEATFTQNDAGTWTWTTVSTTDQATAFVHGPDDAVWFAGAGVDGGQIVARAEPVADGGILVTELGVLQIADWASGPDGRIWFIDWGGNVGRIVAVADAGAIGTVDQIASPGLGTTVYPSPQPTFIAAGADGAMYCTDFYAHRIVRITPAGEVTQCGLPDTVYPWGITAGPDGRMWFAARFDVFALDAVTLVDAGSD
jgi:virginiamycin B lyase